MLFHLEVGNAEPQQAADAFVLFEHHDPMPGARQLLRAGQPGGAGADDGDALIGVMRGDLRFDPTLGPTLVDQ